MNYYKIGAPWGACPMALRPSSRLTMRLPGINYNIAARS